MDSASRQSLPQPTTDLNVARLDLDEFGYCILNRALEVDRVAAVRQRLVEQATAEMEQGLAYRDAGEKVRQITP